MFCANCGERLEEDARFCGNCGARVEDGEAAAGALTEGAMPAEESESPGDAGASGDLAGGSSEPPEGEEPEGIQPQANPQSPGVGAEAGAAPNGAPEGGFAAGGMPGGTAGISEEQGARRPGWNKLAWVELAVLLAAAIGFYWFAGMVNDPATVAKRYYEAVAGQDFERAYGFLEIPEGSFLTEAAFERAAKAGGYEDVVNFKVRPVGSPRKDSDTIVRDYEVEYIQSGSQREQSDEICLVKRKGKRYLLFDDWKVSPGQMLAEDIEIYAPELAQVSVEGIPLKGGQSEDGGMRYRIDAMFTGDYALSVSAPGFSPYTMDMSVSRDGQVFEPSLGYLSRETATQLTQQASNDLVSLMTSLLNNEPSRLVTDSVSPKAASMGQSYENTKSGMGLGSYAYTKSTVSDFSGSGFSYTSDQDGLLVYLDLRYHWAYEYVRSRQSFIGNAPMQREKDVVSSFVYRYQDGAWQLYDFSI